MALAPTPGRETKRSLPCHGGRLLFFDAVAKSSVVSGRWSVVRKKRNDLY
jgi:hypothetical protein